jgi:hypothetical protein
VVTARALFLLSLAGFTAVLAYAWWALPEQVPIHFGSGGAPDRVVGRERAVLEIGLAGYGTAAVLAGSAALTKLLPLSLFNVPHRDDHWAKPENEPVLRALVARDLWVVGAMTMALFAAIELITVAVADDPEPRLGWRTGAVLGAYLVGLTVYLVVAHRSYRPGSRG